MAVWSSRVSILTVGSGIKGKQTGWLCQTRNWALTRASSPSFLIRLPLLSPARCRRFRPPLVTKLPPIFSSHSSLQNPAHRSSFAARFSGDRSKGKLDCFRRVSRFPATAWRINGRVSFLSSFFTFQCLSLLEPSSKLEIPFSGLWTPSSGGRRPMVSGNYFVFWWVLEAY